MATPKKYTTFRDFYPYYLTEHALPINYWLHFFGTLGVITCFVLGLVTSNGWLFIVMPFCGYGFAWAGHYIFEKNRPATFTYPFYSLGSDFVLFYHVLTGQITKKLEEAHEICGIENRFETRNN